MLRQLTHAEIYAVTSNDIKVGLNIEVDGNPWKVIGNSTLPYLMYVVNTTIHYEYYDSPKSNKFMFLSHDFFFFSFFCYLEFLHVKPGKGAAFVRTTLRNYVTGNQVEKTFRAGSKVPTYTFQL